MNPQDPFAPQQQPQSQPTPPVVPQPFVADEPPAPVSPFGSTATIVSPQKRGGKKWIIAVIVVALLAVGGWVAYVMVTNMTNPTGSNGDANVGSLKAGNYNYINACDAFTADDLDAITTRTSDRMEVSAQYAQATDNTGDPQRTYTSDCFRKTSTGALESDYVRLTIQEFSDKAVQDKQNKLKALRASEAYSASDATLNAELGAETKPAYVDSRGNQNLYFTIDNKEVKITMSLIMDKAHTQEWAVAIGKAVKAQIIELAAKPSSVPDYSGVGVTVGTFAYNPACKLWGTADYKSLLGLDPDEGQIHTNVAEKMQSGRTVIHSDCTISQKPAKTELDTGDLSFLKETSVSVSLNTTQYPLAKSASEFMSSTGTAVSGVGERAVTSDTPNGKILTVLKGNTILTIHLDREKEGSNLIETGDLDLLKQIGTTATSRIK